MALKRKITAAEYEALNDSLKGEYKADGDSYVLDLEDTGFNELKAERDAARQALRDREAADAEAKRKAAEDKAKADGDIAALEKSWKEKAERDTAAEREKTQKAQAALRVATVDRVAAEIAHRISTVPALIQPLVASRLDVEIHDETPLVRVKDAAGRPSALSISDLEKEFLDSPAYKAVMKGSDARGGGAGGGGAGGGAPAKKLSEMTATEEAIFANKFPDEYARLTGAK